MTGFGEKAAWFKWYFTPPNGQPVFRSGHQVYYISRVRPSDEGNYTCVAGTGINVANDSAFLTIVSHAEILMANATIIRQEQSEDSKMLMYIGVGGGAFVAAVLLVSGTVYVFARRHRKDEIGDEGGSEFFIRVA